MTKRFFQHAEYRAEMQQQPPTPNELKIGDLVKVIENDHTRPRNIAGRQGYIETLTDESAVVTFNDFKEAISIQHLKLARR